MNKIKIKKGRAKLSDQEIEQQMNFDKFISGYTPFKAWFPKGIKLNLLIVSSAAVLVVAAYMMYHLKTKDAVAYKPFINPPVQSMDIPLETFTFDNTKDTTLVFSTGSLIGLPIDAFEDKEGNDVKGSVQIRYREFHDPIDIMLSGIPMNYDSAGNHYQLESAGMFEVMAFQNGQPVFLKPEKNISVKLVSHSGNKKDYNIYYLDTVKRRWNYVAENTKENNTCIPIFDRNPAYEKELRANDAFICLNKPILPKKENPNAYNFIIDFKKDEFPELAIYNGLRFEPVEGKKKLHEELAQKVWDDVLIERLNDNEHYIITFSSEKESQTIKVIPVVDEKNYAATMKDFKKKQQQYEAALAERKISENEKRDSLYRLNNIFNSYASRSNLNERFNNFIDGSYMETSKDLLLYRTFKVSKLGIWNSDMPYAFLGNNVNFASLNGEHTAQFISTDNQTLILKNVFLIRRNVNSIYTVSEKKFNRFPEMVTIDVMVGMTYDNKLFYIKDEELKHTDSSKGIIRFKMNKLDGVETIPQLKQLLKI